MLLPQNWLHCSNLEYSCQCYLGQAEFVQKGLARRQVSPLHVSISAALLCLQCPWLNRVYVFFVFDPLDIEVIIRDIVFARGLRTYIREGTHEEETQNRTICVPK